MEIEISKEMWNDIDKRSKEEDKQRRQKIKDEGLPMPVSSVSYPQIKLNISNIDHPLLEQIAQESGNIEIVHTKPPVDCGNGMLIYQDVVLNLKSEDIDSALRILKLCRAQHILWRGF